MNCDGIGPAGFIEGIEVLQCPVKAVTLQSKIYLQAYAYYMDGHLPDPSWGGVFDQGGKVMEAIRFIINELVRLEKGKNDK